MKPVLSLALLWLICTPNVMGSTQVGQVDELSVMFSRGDFVAAEAELRRLLTIADDPVARDLLGVALIRQGRFDEAEIELLAAIELQPSHQDAWQHLARLHLTRGQTSQALPALREAARIGDLEKDLALSLAQLEIESGNPEAAKAQLRSVSERFRSVRSDLLLARILERQGKLDEALDVILSARDIAPNSEVVLGYCVDLLLAQGMPVEAIFTLEPLTRMYPSNPEYVYKMGVARMQAGDNMGAVQYLKEARRLTPSKSIVLLALGMALTEEKRYAEAEEALMAGLRLEPDRMEIHGALAEAQASIDRLEQAEVHASRVLEQNPEDTTANFSLGLVRMKQGRFEEAVAAFENAEASDPGSPKIHYQLSMALIRTGQRERSKEHLELYRQAAKEHEAWLDEQGAQVGAGRGGM